jgi:hypothetical protein
MGDQEKKSKRAGDTTGDVAQDLMIAALVQDDKLDPSGLVMGLIVKKGAVLVINHPDGKKN